MARPTCPRSVGFLPGVTYFKPAGVRITELKEVVLGHDEIEAIRLKNLEGLSQEEAAVQMNVSQPTLHRLLSSAYIKMTDAIVNGKALRIEGGNVTLPEASLPICGKGRSCDQVRGGRTKRTGSREIGQDGGRDKIAVTSVDGTMEGMMEERFGRAKRLLLYDPATGDSQVIENGQRVNLPQGAGIGTAQDVIDAGAKAVISGHLGPNAFRVLQTSGVEVYTAVDMTVGDALEAYQEGRLTKLSKADVPGRWREKRE